jgi:hypothetical protein
MQYGKGYVFVSENDIPFKPVEKCSCCETKKIL